MAVSYGCMEPAVTIAARAIRPDVAFAIAATMSCPFSAGSSRQERKSYRLGSKVNPAVYTIRLHQVLFLSTGVYRNHAHIQSESILPW